MEAWCGRILFGLGSDAPIIPVTGEERASLKSTMQWRKPLSMAEIALLAQTAAVTARPGRP